MLNTFQKLCAAVYADGDFAHVADVEQARNVGDTLFAFLMIELATSEGCDSAEEALRRLDMAQANIREIAAALYAQGAAAAEAVSAPSTEMVMLRFRPQAWINDHAVDVDRERADTWAVPLTLFLECFSTEEEWCGRHELRDAMRDEGNAPQWIRHWNGPFEVELADGEAPWAGFVTEGDVRRQNIRHNSRRRLAECGPRQGVDC